MIVSLFGFLLALSLILVILGFIKYEHTELTLIGFFFIFLLSFVVIGGNLEYETGANITSTVVYDNASNIVSTSQDVNYNYNKYDDSTTHNIGYWLSIGSAIAFISVLISLRSGFK